MRVTSRAALVAVALTLLSPELSVADSAFIIRNGYRRTTFDMAGAFAVPPPYRETGDATIDQRGYLHATGEGMAFRGEVGALAEPEGTRTSRSATVNEMYAGHSLGDAYLTVGRQLVSWGVGSGYRPLDVIAGQDLLDLDRIDFEGVPIASVDYYAGSSSATLVAINRTLFDRGSVVAGPYEGAALFRTAVEGVDLLLVGHVVEGEGYGIGVGAAATVGDHLELYASALYRNVYTKQIHRLLGTETLLVESADVFEERKYYNGVRAVVGGAYTFTGGLSLRVEVSHDDGGYTSGETRDLLDLLERQRNALEQGAPEETVYRNIAAASRLLQRRSVVQDAALFRASYGVEAYDASFYLVVTPADGGMVAAGSFESRINGAMIAYMNIRALGGRDGSLWRESGRPVELFAGLRLEGQLW